MYDYAPQQGKGLIGSMISMLFSSVLVSLSDNFGIKLPIEQELVLKKTDYSFSGRVYSSISLTNSVYQSCPNLRIKASLRNL